MAVHLHCAVDIATHTTHTSKAEYTETAEANAFSIKTTVYLPLVTYS